MLQFESDVTGLVKDSVKRVQVFREKCSRRLGIVDGTGNYLSDRDYEYFLDILAMRLCLYLDLMVGSTTANAVDSLERTILGLKVLNVELYSDDWKTLREIITSVGFREQFSDTDACTAHFKHESSSRIHYKWISNSVVAMLGECSFEEINQWVVFDSKANLQDLDLATRCCTEYLDFEAEMSPNPSLWPYRNLIKICAKDLFGELDIRNYPFRPRHSNGATVEVQRSKADQWNKNRQFKVDGEIINYLRYRLPESDWHDAFYVPYRGLDRTCHLVCVPKSMTKNRTISKEPTTLQYLQQDIGIACDEYFITHLKGRINLHDQNESRRLALLGSSDGSYVTVDLSSASDSVSLQHVEEFFGDLPIFYPLMATRSSRVLVSNTGKSKSDKSLVDSPIETIIEMKKFAPMGSCCCFAVETMIFTVLCEVAIRLALGRKSRRFDYVVYGDDIVIRSEAASILLELLEAYEFSVNTTKTFVDNSGEFTFREACGIEAFGGEDITPLRLSRRLVSLTKNDSSRLAGYALGFVELLNEAFLHNFPVLHRWVSSVLSTFDWFYRVLRISVDTHTYYKRCIEDGRVSWIDLSTPFIITKTGYDTNWRAFRVMDIPFSPNHRKQIQVLGVKPRTRTPHHDSNDYFSWWTQCRRRHSQPELSAPNETRNVYDRPRDLKWSKIWVPIDDGAPLDPELRPLCDLPHSGYIYTLEHPIFSYWDECDARP